MTTTLITWDEATELTKAARIKAVAGVLHAHGLDPQLSVEIIAAYQAVKTEPPSDCDNVHPKFGRCALDYGHDGEHWTHEYDDPRRPDGSHPWDY